MIDNQNTENYNKENELLIYLLTNYSLLIERSFQMTVNPRLPEKNTALTPLRKLGYEAGITTESIVYNCFYIYFVIFLTNVVGLNPVMAGTVSLISVCVDAITDPILGWIVDHPKVNPKKFMLVGGLLTGILLTCTFVVVDGSQGFKFAYYVIVSSLMWCSYTSFCIPYYSCCAQMTDDYDEQTKIRGVSSTMNGFVIYGGCVFPILFIGLFGGMGVSDTLCWTMAAGCIGVISIIFGLINYFSIKNVKFIEKAIDQEPENILKTYKDILKLKPMKFFIPWVFFYLFGSAMVSANTNYLLIYSAGVDPEALAGTAVMTLLAFFILSPVFTMIATKWDRKVAVLVAFGITMVGVVICRIIGVDSLFMVYVLTALNGFALAGFWCLFYDFSYDLIELDEYKNRKSRAGCITSFPQLIQKFGNAVGLQVIGIVLAMVGYDASKEVQSASAVSGIQNISTIFLAICLAISIVCIIVYPVNKKVYARLPAANERRRAGEIDFVDPEIDKILILKTQ